MTDAIHSTQPTLAHVDTWESMAVDYLDGTLLSADRALVDTHLKACVACREALGLQRDVMALTRNVPEAAVPPALSTRVLGALRTGPAATSRPLRRNRRGTPTFWEWLVRARWAPAAVAVVVVLVGVAAWGGMQAQNARSGREGGSTVTALTMSAGSGTSGSEAVSVTAAVSPDVTGRSTGQEDSVTAAGPSDTTSAATTTSEPTPGSTEKTAAATTTLAATAATTSSEVSAPATLAATSTTYGTTGGVVAALGLTPVFLAVGTTATESAQATLTSLPDAARMQQMPSRLWRGSTTFAAVMGDAEMDAFMTALTGAGFTSAVEFDLPYDTGYLEEVARELGLAPGPKSADNLVIVTVKGG